MRRLNWCLTFSFDTEYPFVQAFLHFLAVLFSAPISRLVCVSGLGPNSTDYLHLVIEALKLGFVDTTWYCADPAKVEVPLSTLLSKEYATKRRQLLQRKG